MRRVRPLVALAILAVGVPIGAVGAPPSGDDLGSCRDRQQIEVRDDHWVRIHPPKMDPAQGEGPRTIVDWATPPNLQKRIYMTNGVVVKASTDAGCTWSSIKPATSQLGSSLGGLPQREVPTLLSAATDDALYLATYDVAGVDQVGKAVYHPHVYIAEALIDPKTLKTATFTEVGGGTLPAGKPVILTASPYAEDTAYVVVEGPEPDVSNPDVLVRHLYAKTAVQRPEQIPPTVPFDPPSTWNEIGLPDGFTHVDGVSQTLGGHGLWIWQGDKYAFSPDVSVDEPAWTTTSPGGQVLDIESGASATLIAVKEAQGVKGYYFDPEGKQYIRPIALPIAPTDIAHGSGGLIFAVVGKSGTWGYDLAHEKWENITPKGVPAFTKVQMPTSIADRIVLAQSGDDWYRFDTYPGELFIEPEPFIDGWGNWKGRFPDGHLTHEVLRPTHQVVTVEPGKPAKVPVDFTAPGEATRLEVYFLIDSTGSMDKAVDGLRASVNNIAKGLKDALPQDIDPKTGKRKWQACLGLGNFKDFTLGNINKQDVYVRDVKIPKTCDTPKSNAQNIKDIEAALKEFQVGGGGGDLEEAQTLALHQAVTGSGQGPGTRYKPNSKITVPPDQEAGFTADAFKVIVMITDQWFHQEPADYPSIPEVIQTLNTEKINVVSVLENTAQTEKDKKQAREELELVAKGTDTYAPPTGLDCDSDGFPDLRPNAPLVCDEDGSGTNIGPAILSLLLGIYDPGSLAVQVYDHERVVQRPIKGETSKIVNMKRQNTLAFVMTVMCTSKQDGQDLPIGLLGTVRAVPKVPGDVIVQCRSKPVVPPPVQPPPDPVVDVIPPAKPPVAIALPNPPPAPAQPISNLNLNAGFSKQEEQQYQLAAVSQDASELQVDDAEELELAMSDYRARDAAAGAAALGGATLISAAGAVAYRRRLRVQRAKAYSRF